MYTARPVRSTGGGGREGKVGVGLRHFRSPASQREKQEVHFTALTVEEAGGRGARRVRSSRRPPNAAFRGEGWGGSGALFRTTARQSLHFSNAQSRQPRGERSRSGQSWGGRTSCCCCGRGGRGGGSASADQESLSPFIKMFSFSFFYSTSDRKSLIHSKREKKIKIEGNYTESAPCAC